MKYEPAWWLPGPHARTLWGKLARRQSRTTTERERWELPDGDFVDLHRLRAAAGRPHLLILHGLEGSARSHYARGLFTEARRRDWSADLLIFRSCGGEINRLARAYHSGETGDLAIVHARLRAEQCERPIGLVGFSLGGNVLLKWLGERSDDRPAGVAGAVAVSAPFDLARSARHIDRGFSRVYQAHFLRSLRRKALAKLGAFPGLVPMDTVARARTLFEFDDVFTAPVHGFAGALDYYTRSSAIRWLDRIRTPTLLLSAADDPFLPPDVLDEVRRIASANPVLEIEFHDRGGHVGFIGGRVPWKPDYYAERRIADFLAARFADRQPTDDPVPAAPVTARER